MNTIADNITVLCESEHADILVADYWWNGDRTFPAVRFVRVSEHRPYHNSTEQGEFECPMALTLWIVAARKRKDSDNGESLTFLPDRSGYFTITRGDRLLFDSRDYMHRNAGEQACRQ
jgi:hypothetical protein